MLYNIHSQPLWNSLSSNCLKLVEKALLQNLVDTGEQQLRTCSGNLYLKSFGHQNFSDETLQLEIPYPHSGLRTKVFIILHIHSSKRNLQTERSLLCLSNFLHTTQAWLSGRASSFFEVPWFYLPKFSAPQNCLRAQKWSNFCWWTLITKSAVDCPHSDHHPTRGYIKAPFYLLSERICILIDANELWW